MFIPQWLKSLCTTAYKHLITYNHFDSQSTNPFFIRRELLSTRLYLILLVISVSILTTYTSFTVRIKDESIKSPTYSQYQQLNRKYSNTLQCLCTNLSIEYGKFVKTEPLFHQVCSSDFITQRWIDFIFAANILSLWPIDVRTSLSAMWQLIQSFCQNSYQTIMSILDHFNKTLLISPILFNEELLKAKVQSILFSQRDISTVNLIQSITVINQITQANQFLSTLGTNYIAVTHQFGLSKQPNSYRNISQIQLYLYIGRFANLYIQKNSIIPCSCQTNASCPLEGDIYLYNMSEQFGIYNMNRIHSNGSLTGVIIDCLPLQMTFASSLECFFQQSCLNFLLSTYKQKMNVSILNESRPSRFNQTTTIQSLLNELFIEELQNETNYQQYYLTCLPKICSYSYNHRFDWTYVLTTFIGLCGGITKVLSIIAWYFIGFILYLYERFFSNTVQTVRRNSHGKCFIQMKNILLKFKTKLINLNFYSKHSRDRIRVYHGCLSTRLYLLTLIISICVIIIYLFMLVETVNENIPSPSIKEYQMLHEEYFSTLKCPCSQISIVYNDFLRIEVKYHEICSSDFIQPWWYNRFPARNSSDTNLDFFQFASSFFHALAALCELTNETIQYEIKRFLSTTFVNADVLSNDSFRTQINSLTNSFIQLTQIQFSYRIFLTQTLLHSNQYMSNTGRGVDLRMLLEFTDNLYYVYVITEPLYKVSKNETRCYCVLDSTCSYENEVFSMQVGCTVMNSVLKSSLICWFNASCIDLVLTSFYDGHWLMNDPPSPLNSTLPSRYSLTTPMETIFNEMMVEEWNITFSYDSYFQECQPSSCSFTYEKKTDFVYLITIIISLFGGIHTILLLISPFIIKFVLGLIEKIKNYNLPSMSNNLENHRFFVKILIFINRFFDKILMLNVFDSESNNLETIHRERVITRCYLLTLFLLLYIITICSMISNGTISISLPNPSENDYKTLTIWHSETLECPCRKIAVKYKYFVGISITSHQICSSNFIGTEWRDYLFLYPDWSDYNSADIRSRGSIYFLFLSTLCQLSQTTINNAINAFLNETFISTQIVSNSEFRLQIDTTLFQLQKSTAAEFSQSLNLLRDVMNGNTLVSSYFLNWFWWIDFNRTYTTIPINPVVMKDGCSCGTRSDCIKSGGIYYRRSDQQMFAIPGWNVGCSVVETVLRSTLECFYDQTCIDSLIYAAITDKPAIYYHMNISAMHYSNKSRFRKDSFIQSLIDELFVEKWNIKTYYSSFYNACDPIYCSYTIQKDDYYMYSASRVLGLYGGLTVILRVIVPLLVKLFYKMKNVCNRNQVVPFN
ncbi:unnamed protein product [Adineta ricciae]|uniref:Uncharacterized protein n=2 Tax=Adineta ricciae TaxID=249248 RepID=A0A815LNX1_ADIRI|nr:unnamed protein product [Adineta ricciae]